MKHQKHIKQDDIAELEQQVEAQLQDGKSPVEFVAAYKPDVSTDISITPKHVFIDETIYVPGFNS